jgi:hypothetical protein
VRRIVRWCKRLGPVHIGDRLDRARAAGSTSLDITGDRRLLRGLETVYTLGEPPLLTRLRPARRVLIAGAGGGFDVYAGVPLATALRAQGKRCTWRTWPSAI